MVKRHDEVAPFREIPFKSELGTKALRRREWLAIHGPCVMCGSWNQLEIDHIDPSTKKSHNIWKWGADRREAELAKCQVLCRPCHIVKTLGKEPYQHGTPRMYKKHHCRCSVCRLWNAENKKRKPYYVRLKAIGKAP